MEKSFSWQNFDRMAKALESLGYVVVVVGLLVGIALFIMGGWMMRMIGLGIMAAGFLIAAYHISFSMLMNAIRDITKCLEERGETLINP